MRHSLARSLALLVLGVFLVAPAYAEGDNDKSPEDVFKAFVAAVKKEDVKTSMSYLTRDSQSAIAGLMLIVARTNPFQFDKKGEEARKAFDDVLKRLGISDDALRKIPKDLSDAIMEPPKNIAAWGETVKDKPAFVADVLQIVTKLVGGDIVGFKQFGEASIKDVKIEGEQAKAQVTIPSAGNTKRTETYYFKLENQVWKIDFIRKMEEPPPASSPAPPPQAQRQAPPSYSRPGPLRRLLNRLFNW
jgi:hypothetical protein